MAALRLLAAAALALLLPRPAGGMPKGLFVSTLSYAENGSYARTTTRALELISAAFAVPTSADRVGSLALDHLATKEGQYIGDGPGMRQLLGYADRFEEVFVGGCPQGGFTSDVYCTGLLNSSFHSEWLRCSLGAAKLFAAQHPTLNFTWYIPYEAAGNYFSRGCVGHGGVAVSATQILNAYSSLFSQLAAGLVAIRRTGVMWSPTFNEPASTVTATDRAALVDSMRRLFDAVPQLTSVVNQDSIGKHSVYNTTTNTISYGLTCADTIFYQELLREASAAAAKGPTIQVNMELFSRKGAEGPLWRLTESIPADPLALRERECCYQAANLTLGPSWDISSWYRANFEPWDPATVSLKSDDGVPLTDDPPQPRGPRWAPGLPSPLAAIDPRQHGRLRPGCVASEPASGCGLPRNATPLTAVLTDSLYTFAAAANASHAWAAEYGSNRIHRVSTSGPLSPRVIHPRSEFFGEGGVFAMAAAADGTLYLGIDGNGCMPTSAPSVPCAFVRRISTAGFERRVVLCAPTTLPSLQQSSLLPLN